MSDDLRRALAELVALQDKDGLPMAEGWHKWNRALAAARAALAAQPADPVALTDEEMKDAMSKASVIVFDPKLWDLLIYAARAIERAHGIKSEGE